MRDIGEDTIRRIDWQELTPVVLLLRLFETATGFRVVFLSLLGILLTVIAGYLVNGVSETSQSRSGKIVIEDITEGRQAAEARVQEKTARSLTHPVYVEPLLFSRSAQTSVDSTDSAQTPTFREGPGTYVWRLAQRSVFVPWDIFSTAGVRAFTATPQSWSQRGIAFSWLVLLAFIWSICGGMVCRTAACRLTIDQSESPKELWKFMKKRGTGFVSSLLIVTIGILFCLVPIKICGWLFSVPVLDYAMAIGFPVALLFGFFAVVLAFGLFVGWPMLFAAVGVDGSDGFDAVSRMFSYVYQRPLHYLFYWTVAGVLGILAFVLVSIFVDGVVYLTIIFGGFPMQAAAPSFGTMLLPEVASGLSRPGSLVVLWCGMAQMLKMAFLFAWFWTTGTAIYLLLRRSVDATPFVEVYRQGAAAEEPKTLPKIKLDAQGAPEIEQ